MKEYYEYNELPKQAPLQEGQEVMTGIVRLSYMRLFDLNDNDKYTTTLLIPKSDVATYEALKAAELSAAEEHYKAKMPKAIPSIIKDGDGVNSKGNEYSDDEKGHWVMTVSSKRPVPVAKKGQEKGTYVEVTKDKIKSGDYAIVFLRAAGYKTGPNEGITFYINKCLLAAPGHALGAGGKSMSQAFATVDLDSLPDIVDEVEF